MTEASEITRPGKAAKVDRIASVFPVFTGKPALEDRIEIEDVICAMTIYVDNFDYDAAQALFTEDATLNYSSTYGPGWEAIPQQDFWNTMRQYHRGYDSGVHPITNFMIRSEGDRATCQSFVGAIMKLDDEYWPNGGVYRHLLVKVDGEWKIQHLEYELRYSIGDKRDWIVEESQRRALLK